MYSFYDVSFYCYYPENVVTKHQSLALADIPRWIEAYRFTHPDCISISVKVWFN